MSTKGSSGAKSGTQKDISLAYVLAGGILGWLLGQGVWPGSVISPLATSIPYFDGLTGSLLAKYNVPWGLNPSPRISSAANALPSNVCDVSPATLAVISEPFERDALQPLRTTKVAPNWQELQATSAGGKLKDCVFAAHDSAFHGLIGPDPTVKLLAQKDYTFAHEGPVWLPAIGKLFFVSNRLGDTGGTDQYAELWLLDPETLETSQVRPRVPIIMGNGATNWSPSEVLITSQGGNNTGGALFVLDVVSGAARKLLDNFQGLQFNSPNDVVVSRDGVIYFTDPSYGLQQKFRTMTQVGDYVWRFNARTGDTAIVDEKFLQPNGVVLSPDGRVAYITDTGCKHANTSDGGQCTAPNTPRSIYAFDILKSRDGASLLANKRLFAVPDVGAPDGIKVDLQGNVWTGVGDGVAVFSPSGKLLGKILVGEVSNIVFAGDVLVMMKETEVLAVKLAARGVVLPGMLAPAIA
ncbi:calcium-dependent phosphotriesterase [Coccomyxa subellipsoidea C-169]|uniref:Calcium-dependent phosphotriesterase n=1 Tax=Coccomyxa subellipsoidea (strain C-169) TaxID=574566 RepID=I0Z845_COCSC|nr:calcium-dependent phosphotriesterase [Coccomyxa subellipsoidea C-169]EIE26814.1 calcium-dependent phosphotriesterase [Coccomyxa subellipsoidea C-169]|eukprot:XP_005651358.1 calcium-dependent phosphotriesterase [Coccomyxa subellipsoidea C-169]